MPSQAVAAYANKPKEPEHRVRRKRRDTAASNLIRASTKHKKGDRKLSYQLPAGVETEPLCSLDSPEELRKLADRVRTMWAKTNGVT